MDKKKGAPFMPIPVADLPKLPVPVQQEVEESTSRSPVTIGDGRYVVMSSDQYQVLISSWEEVSEVHDLTIAFSRQVDRILNRRPTLTTEHVIEALGLTQEDFDAVED